MFGFLRLFGAENIGAPSWKLSPSYRIRAVLYYADSLILPVFQDFQCLGRVKHMGYGIERNDAN